MKKVFFLLWALLLCGVVSMNAQVRIGGDTAPHPAAVLDLNADDNPTPAGNKGALALPRVQLTDDKAVLNEATPVNGMLVYNTGGTLNAGIYYWDGTQWLKVTDGSTTTKTLYDTIAPWITWIPIHIQAIKGGSAPAQPGAFIPQMSLYNTDTCVSATPWVNPWIWSEAGVGSPTQCFPYRGYGSVTPSPDSMDSCFYSINWSFNEKVIYWPDTRTTNYPVATFIKGAYDSPSYEGYEGVIPVMCYRRSGI